MNKKTYLIKNIAIFLSSYFVIVALMVILLMTGPAQIERLAIFAGAFILLTIHSSVLFLLLLNWKKRIW